MADPYANLGEADKAVQTRIADALDTRATEAAQVEIRRAYLSGLELPPDASAVELGCGTGHVTRDMQTLAGATNALGIEPSDILLDRARMHFGSVPGLSYQAGDARDTGLPAESFDLVVMHTLLCHVPGPERALAEAVRLLKPGGVMAICDGDYATSTAAIGDYDPLEPLVKFMINENVTNLWIMREIDAMLTTAGLTTEKKTGHGYVAEGDAAYFLTIIDRAADLMADRKLIARATAGALKAEARDRVARGAFFGFMSYVSVIAKKPGGAQ